MAAQLPHQAGSLPATAAGRSCVTIGAGSVVSLHDPARPEVGYSATFDHVFAPDAGQEAVFAMVGADMVENCMAGEREPPGRDPRSHMCMAWSMP